MGSMQREINASGSDEDKGNMRHILNGTQDASWSNAVTLDVLLTHCDAQACHLQRHHVFALRYYTTSSFKSINDPLRDRRPAAPPHPLAATTYFLNEGLGKLEAVDARKDDFRQPRTFWRGLKDRGVTFDIIDRGGTELAFGSTSTDQAVALKFATVADDGSAVQCPLLLEFCSEDFNTHGRDVRFLSVYPGENEVLYAPLTYLRCDGVTKKTLPDPRDGAAPGSTVRVLVVKVRPVPSK